jgi:signal transduction histidine kinase
VQRRSARIAQRAQVLAATTDEIVWTLNPRNDSLRDLAGYLSDFAQSFLRASPARCRLDVTEALPEAPVSAGARHNLLLAFKEALNNAVKHSGATEVWVRIQAAPGMLRVAVEDNGRGFGTGPEAGKGDGLVNMRERLAAVGGRTEITSVPGKGTQACFLLPLSA